MINGSALNSSAINALASAGGVAPQPDTGALAVPVVLSVTGLPSGQLSVQVALTVLPKSLAASGWDVRLVVGETDLSDRLQGTIEIEAEEGAARIASVTLSLVAGDTLASYSGQVMLVEARPAPGAAWVRRFSGKVMLPVPDLESGTMVLHAADRRHDLLASTSRADLAAMLGGYWSDLVESEAANSLQYAEARLATVAGSWDLDAFGNPRMTLWNRSGTDVTVTDDDIIDGTLQPRPVSLTDVVNLVTNDTVSLGGVSATAICGLVHNAANDTGKSATDNITANNRPLIGGTVEPGAVVTVTLAGQSMTTAAGADGKFQVQPRLPLALGVHTPHIHVEGSWTWEAWGTSFVVASKAEADLGAATAPVVEKVASTDVSFEYRYYRLHQKKSIYQWSMGITYPELVLGRNHHAFILPERQLFESAASQSGWTLNKATYTSPKQGTQVVGYVDTNGIVHEGSSSSGTDVAEVLIYKNEYTGDPAADPRCESATLELTRRVAQPVTERWRISVSAPDSIARLGTRKAQGQTAAADATSHFNADAWEKDIKAEPVITDSTDLVSLPGMSRADAENAILYLAAKARRQILASHRASRVAMTLWADLTMDLTRRYEVSTHDLHAVGKVARFVERYSIQTGQSRMEVELAISSLVAAGTAPDDPLLSPVITGAANYSGSQNAAVPSAWEGRGSLIDGTAWTTGAMGDRDSQYPRSVSLSTPPVDAYLTDPVDRLMSYALSVAIPVDPFELR
ncbi:Ig-like domain-containing protein [uncultured Aquitalea sp.]|uniref:Ig-like domain-containing protein n=1 Tax=uncultured Aquitalea sp. TaxID=540272 RepID=UPI0025F43BD2|nr:Ig-like domain-containing protein [uncultured Aquitalea sp.]